MQNYPPELVAVVRHKYLYTDETLEQIAAACQINARDVSRMRELEGWPSRNARIRRVPRLTQAVQDVQALEATVGRAELVPAQPGTSVPAASAQTEPDDDDNAGTAPAPLPALPAVERIERLVEQELAAEERARAELGAKRPRRRADAERCARTLATLTQTLHALARLRGGAAPDQGSNDDNNDMPADIDEFRRDLARRIRVFVQSRTGGGIHDAARSADGGSIQS